ncbi:thiamine-phosphate kinase [Curvibacter sp. CHRR-16]|uniref:thiamine-phosphate kinase n=1 Tax=Curvibacter sp. CHRR-16 TaxID=2835872 RepID=UPI001BDA9978|nr:thiamine-phosphate kinase [Curvibacter sp. CHRR-16]MBT0570589.1 thiamine-phosphate kinase [Curvibacter sp. CHRR-16]
MGEFALIRRYFDHPVPANSAVALGVGDDCALLHSDTSGWQWAISTDMLVSGRHFFADVDPALLGHKALAVNLSDLAACGATPRAFTLALALPEANPDWLHAFASGLLALAREHGCVLMGGDTTRGPLNICITVMGQVPPGQALLRHQAQVGDDIYASGHVGDAALALRALQGRLPAALPNDLLAHARHRLEQPTPRVALGQALRGLAHAAADISDGLAGDLGHILQRSGVGATLHLQDAMQLIAASAYSTGSTAEFDQKDWSAQWLDCILHGGDDYELVFTASPQQRGAIAAAAAASHTRVTRIGQIETESGLRLRHANGQVQPHSARSFDHFAS